MLNNTEVKANDMHLTIKQVFNSMTDNDFMMLHKTGQLKNFCGALSLDLNSKHDEKDNTYTA
jgi:hypothetical protein